MQRERAPADLVNRRPDPSDRARESLAVGKRDHRLLQLQRSAAPHLPPHRHAGARRLGRKAIREKKPLHTDECNTRCVCQKR